MCWSFSQCLIRSFELYQKCEKFCTSPSPQIKPSCWQRSRKNGLDSRRVCLMIYRSSYLHTLQIGVRCLFFCHSTDQMSSNESNVSPQASLGHRTCELTLCGVLSWAELFGGRHQDSCTARKTRLDRRTASVCMIYCWTCTCAFASL